MSKKQAQIKTKRIRKQGKIIDIIPTIKELKVKEPGLLLGLLMSSEKTRAICQQLGWDKQGWSYRKAQVNARPKGSRINLQKWQEQQNKPSQEVEISLLINSSGSRLGYLIDPSQTGKRQIEYGWENAKAAQAISGLTLKEIEREQRSLVPLLEVFQKGFAQKTLEKDIIKEFSGLSAGELRAKIGEYPQVNTQIIREVIKDEGKLLITCLRLNLDPARTRESVLRTVRNLQREGLQNPRGKRFMRKHDPTRWKDSKNTPQPTNITELISLDQWAEINNIGVNNARAMARKGRISPARLIAEEGKEKLAAHLVYPNSVIMAPGQASDIEELNMISMNSWLKREQISKPRGIEKAALKIGAIKVKKRTYLPTEVTKEEIFKVLKEKGTGRKTTSVNILDQASQEMISKLSAREQHIVLKRRQGKSLEEIGQRLNIGRERVRQIEKIICLKLQKAEQEKEKTET